jgi:uncharacterized membrane protein
MRPLLPHDVWKAEIEQVAARKARATAQVDNRTAHERRCDLSMEFIAVAAVIAVVIIAAIWRPW